MSALERVRDARPYNMAWHVARDAHAGQFDKAGRPYIDHPAAVAWAVKPLGPEYESTAWLHDVVEDSEWTLDELREVGIPERVVTAVDALTKRAGESYLDAVRRAAANPIARVVKLADNAHNSDETRLALLDEKTAERLRRKYAQAREVLEVAGG